MFFRMVYKSGPTFLPFCHKARVYRQTDRQTDRILIARPRLHCMQRGKNQSITHRYFFGWRRKSRRSESERRWMALSGMTCRWSWRGVFS